MGAESKIEKAVSDYAKKQGFYVRKFKSSSQRGVPDRLFLTPDGVTFFIEFKRPGGKTSALQDREINEIKKRGGIAMVCDSTEQGKTIIDTMKP